MQVNVIKQRNQTKSRIAFFLIGTVIYFGVGFCKGYNQFILSPVTRGKNLFQLLQALIYS